MPIQKVCLTFDFGMTFAIKMRQTTVVKQRTNGECKTPQ